MSDAITLRQAAEQALNAIEGAFAGGVAVWALGGSGPMADAESALRKALRAALEQPQPAQPEPVARLIEVAEIAMEGVDPGDALWPMLDDAINSARANITEPTPAPPAENKYLVQWCQSIVAARKHPRSGINNTDHATGRRGCLAAAPAPAQPDPVAWQWRRKGNSWSLDMTFSSEVFATTSDSEVRPLYAAPAPAQPDQIDLPSLQWPGGIVYGDFASLDAVRKMVAAAPAQPEPRKPTHSQLVAAARVLNQRAADACGVDADDQWKIYGHEFLQDAEAAIDAAMGKGDSNGAK